MILVRYKRVASTNNTAKVLANRGAREWTVVFAEVQTRGRGRSGRKWQSPRGGLWFSVILRPKISPGNVAMLQFFASNATRKAIMEETGIEAGTKWPNDIIFEKRKMAGLLVESKSEGNQVSFVVVGIGLNVNQSQNTLPEGATSIYATSRERHNVEQLMNRIVENMQHDYSILETPDKILNEWWTNCIHRSKNVEIQTGGQTRSGISKGIDTDGSLLLQEDARTEHIMEGTLRVMNEQKTSPDSTPPHPSRHAKS